jgi:ubiquitin-protein ligase
MPAHVPTNSSVTMPWEVGSACAISVVMSRFVFADISELKLDDKGMKIDFYNGKEDLMNFKVHIAPDEGIYKGGKFIFECKVPSTYPHEPPKITCETQVYHPNIDMEGHVCLNILREDWKPVLTIQSVMYGLQFLMLEPNPDDPLNKEVSHAEVPVGGCCPMSAKHTHPPRLQEPENI